MRIKIAFLNVLTLVYIHYRLVTEFLLSQVQLTHGHDRVEISVLRISLVKIRAGAVSRLSKVFPWTN